MSFEPDYSDDSTIQLTDGQPAPRYKMRQRRTMLPMTLLLLKYTSQTTANNLDELVCLSYHKSNFSIPKQHITADGALLHR